VAFAGESLADGADGVGRVEVDADGGRRETESGGEPFADGGAKILEFRAFEDDGGVDVGDGIAAIGGEFLGVEEELNGVRAAPLGGGIGEMHADVAEGEGAEDGVGDGVREDIGIGVAGETEFAGDGDAAEDERAASFDAVSIPALADAEGGIHC